jgi:hypothetical protein
MASDNLQELVADFTNNCTARQFHPGTDNLSTSEADTNCYNPEDSDAHSCLASFDELFSFSEADAHHEYDGHESFAATEETITMSIGAELLLFMIIFNIPRRVMQYLLNLLHCIRWMLQRLYTC